MSGPSPEANEPFIPIKTPPQQMQQEREAATSHERPSAAVRPDGNAVGVWKSATVRSSWHTDSEGEIRSLLLRSRAGTLCSWVEQDLAAFRAVVVSNQDLTHLGEVSCCRARFSQRTSCP